mgnify:CR=1 FL=1
MNFQVPQFIEIEDRIFGPLTFKQFVYIAGGAGLAFLFWALIPVRFIAILLILPTIAFALMLAFYKVNERAFNLVLEAAFKYALTTKLYIWRRTEPKLEAGSSKPEAGPRGIKIPKLSESKLKDLSWSLDVKEKIG